MARTPLGRFGEAGIRSLLARRLLLAVPALALAVEIIASVAPRRAGARALELAADVAFWREARRLLRPREWESITRGPVILMYHAIGSADERPSRYIIPRRSFERQYCWLRARGYALLSVGQLIEAQERGIPPPRIVVLTFDDGYGDNVRALVEAAIPATVFVVTDKVGMANNWDREGLLSDRPLFGWDEARDLKSRGVEIGGHSRSHPLLTEVTPERMQAEVRGSLQDLCRELGPGCYTFAYPHGRFDDTTRAAVEEAGAAVDDGHYAAACCSRGGVNDPYIPRYALRRVEIKGTDSLLSFILMVGLGRRITPAQLLRSLLFG